jgi:hypothetical protein
MLPYLAIDYITYSLFKSFVSIEQFGYQDLYDQLPNLDHFIDISKAIQATTEFPFSAQQKQKLVTFSKLLQEFKILLKQDTELLKVVKKDKN